METGFTSAFQASSPDGGDASAVSRIGLGGFYYSAGVFVREPEDA